MAIAPIRIHRISGFTIVELLVVITVIALLCSMVLPTMTKAREMARRVSCASNERQMFMAAGSYAGDSADALPPLTYAASYGYGTRGYIYTEAANAPVRFFLRDYCGVDLNMGATTSGLINSRKNMTFCPSMQVVNQISDDDWRHHTGYAPRCFGWFGTSSEFGTSRFFAIGDRGPLGPKVFLMDYIMNFSTTQLDNGNNHAFAGGNVCAGDGSVKWINYSDTVADVNSNNTRVPLGYYSQMYYSGMIDTTSPYYGELPLYYPDGIVYGLNHQPEMWGSNRKLYGYR